VCPFLKAIHEEFIIKAVHIETVHSYTNDQHLVDNFHPKARRGRAAALNMVLTETGASKAVKMALPELIASGCTVTGNAIRVPTPDVSLAILICDLGRNVTVEEINQFLCNCASSGPYMNQIEYAADEEVVSSDFVGTRKTGILDSNATIVSGSRVNLYLYYDNEFGFCCQVVRLTQLLAGVVHPKFPPTSSAAPSDSSTSLGVGI